MLVEAVPAPWILRAFPPSCPAIYTQLYVPPASLTAKAPPARLSLLAAVKTPITPATGATPHAPPTICGHTGKGRHSPPMPIAPQPSAAVLILSHGRAELLPPLVLPHRWPITASYSAHIQLSSQRGPLQRPERYLEWQWCFARPNGAHRWLKSASGVVAFTPIRKSCASVVPTKCVAGFVPLLPVSFQSLMSAPQVAFPSRSWLILVGSVKRPSTPWLFACAKEVPVAESASTRRVPVANANDAWRSGANAHISLRPDKAQHRQSVSHR